MERSGMREREARPIPDFALLHPGLLVPIGKGSLDELNAFVKSETVRWAKVIQNAGLAGTQ
jgi:hypothetical protein